MYTWRGPGCLGYAKNWAIGTGRGFIFLTLIWQRFTRESLELIEAVVQSKLIFSKAVVHPRYNERCSELIREKRQAEGTPAYKDVVK